MATNEVKIPIPARLYNAAEGGHVAGAVDIYDDDLQKKQSDFNSEVREALGTGGTVDERIVNAVNTETTRAEAVEEALDGRVDTLESAVGSNGSVDQRIAAAKSEVIGDAASDYNTLGKLEDKIQAEASARESAVSTEAQARQDAITAETNRATTRENQIYDLVHTPEQHYVTVPTYADLANIASPSDDTVYRVSSYNGKTSQVDNTVYSEYGYDGTNFVFLCVKSQIDEVYDISAHHSNNTYVDLAVALDGGNNIPQELRRGGMSVKFVQSSDNKYVQYRLMNGEWSTTESDWQGVDDEPTADSDNLVKSGGINAEIDGKVFVSDGAKDSGYYNADFIKNGNIYQITSNLTVASASSIAWQIYGCMYGSLKKTAKVGGLGVASRTFDSTGLTFDYYEVRFNQDVTAGSFEIKRKNNINDRISALQTSVDENTSDIKDLSTISTVVDDRIFVLTGAQQTSEVSLPVMQNGKSYIIKTDVSVENPSKLVFQIFARKGTSYPALCGLFANQEKVFNTFDSNGNFDYDHYYYRILQNISSGNVVICNHNGKSNCERISALEEDFAELDLDINGLVVDENRSFVNDEYIHVNLIAGNRYKVITDLDAQIQLPLQLMCKRNGSWVVEFGFLSEAEKTITIPSDSTENAFWVRTDCSGGIKVIDVTCIDERINYIYENSNFSEEIVITANSDVNSNADFKGNDAIQQAYDSIIDASPNKRYVIRATGEFVASALSDYQEHGTQFTFINGKDYVSLDGISSNNCIIRCSLPQTVAENKLIDSDFVASDYGKYQPMWWDYKGDVKNITFVARNIRYPLHIDNSGGSLLDNTTINVENCILVHEGKYGDSVGSVGGGANGFAVSQGMTLNLLNCIFMSARGAAYGHDNKNFKYPGVINYTGCKWINNAPAYDNVEPTVVFECLSKYGVSSIMNVSGGLPDGVRYRGYMTNLDTVKRNADSICNIVNMDTYPLPQTQASVSTIALAIYSDSTSSPSSVRVDETSSAFDAIFGYSDEVAYMMNTRCCRRRQYGYEYKDGGNGLKGVAIGTRNVAQAQIGGTSYANYLGKRLGDCSITNKVLTVIVDGVSHNIVFNKNYDGTAENVAPNYSNSDIIAEMNTALSGYATVGYYSMDNDWMPNFLKGLEVRFNGDTGYIEKGMAIVFDGRNVRKAKQSDGRIDGTALDSAAVGDNLRIITKGEIAYQDVRYSIKKASGSPDISTLFYGTELSVSQTDGVFEVGTDCPVAKIGIGNTVII